MARTTGLLALLAAPWIAARAMSFDPATGKGTHLWVCQFLEATGIPCPACGATRAFVLAAHGDWSFLHYNWAWIVVWAALLVMVVGTGWRRAHGKPAFGPRMRRLGTTLNRRPWLAGIAGPLLILAATGVRALPNPGG